MNSRRRSRSRSLTWMYGRSSVTTASYPRWKLSIEILSNVNLRPHRYPPLPDGVARRPGAATRDPGGHVLAVHPVIVSEPLREVRHLVDAGKPHAGQPHDERVAEQDRPTEQERLPDDRRQDREVHRVADETVKNADEQGLGRGGGGRRGAATGAGAPRPARTNRANACSNTTPPAAVSAAPHARTAVGQDIPTSQP